MLKKFNTSIIFLVLCLIFTLTACGECTHVDTNRDGKCDECGAITRCEVCKDENKDGKCDKCALDVACPVCIDDNGDAKCDVCGGAVECEECEDSDGDGACDRCGGEVLSNAALVLYDGNALTFNIILAKDTNTSVRS